jgi:hypothetical protein
MKLIPITKRLLDMHGNVTSTPKSGGAGTAVEELEEEEEEEEPPAPKKRKG